MSKPVLFWTVARDPYSAKFVVVAVTTVNVNGHAWGSRADRTGAWHGRHTSTWNGGRQCFGRFSSQVEAEAKLPAISDAFLAGRQRLREHDQIRSKIETDTATIIDAICGAAQ